MAVSGASAAVMGTHFNVANVLTDNLGSAFSSSFLDAFNQPGYDEGYCPIPEEPAYSEIPEGTYERFPNEAISNHGWNRLEDDLNDPGSSLFGGLSSSESTDHTFMRSTMGMAGELAYGEGLEFEGMGALHGGHNEAQQIISAKQLRKMFPHAKQSLLDAYLPELNTQLNAAGINTPKRLAFFFSTVNEETGGMTALVEDNFNYSIGSARKNFSKLSKLSDQQIKALGHGELFVNTVYAFTNGNGDVHSGDGHLFRGRGLFHYSGRENYYRLGGDAFIKNPNIVLEPKNDVMAAVKYWKTHKLDKLVDAIELRVSISPNKKVLSEDFNLALRQINAGRVNIDKRAASYNQYIKIF